MAKISFLLAFLYLFGYGRGGRAERGIVSYDGTRQSCHHGRIHYPDEGRKKVLEIAAKEVGIQESHDNTGPRVDQYNAYVGLKKVPWCASFISWVFGQAGYPQPRTAWSPSLFPRNRLAQNPVAGMVLGVYFPELKRVAHCGLVTQVKENWIFSVEGNTSKNGGREGTGVFRRMRHKRTIHCYANWL